MVMLLRMSGENAEARSGKKPGVIGGKTVRMQVPGDKTKLQVPGEKYKVVWQD